MRSFYEPIVHELYSTAMAAPSEARNKVKEIIVEEWNKLKGTLINFT
jgi:hypothetical protein